MKRSERHHLKEDEFVSWLEKTSFWISENQKNVVNAVLVVTGAGLLLGGLWVYRDRQTTAAHDALTEALREYHAPVVATEEASSAQDGPTFTSAEERYRTALASFATVAANYGSYEPARQALYYKALCHAELGENEKAAEVLEEARSGGTTLIYYLATRTLASVRMALGDHQGASELYRALLSDRDVPLPKDQLLYDLARTEEQAGNLVEARQYYEQLREEYPSSLLQGEAQSRIDVLEYRLVSRLGSDVSTESVEAPGSQGASRAKYRVYSTEAQRSEPGCIDARMQHDFRDGTLNT